MTKQEKLIVLAIGEASMCWQYPAAAGKYDGMSAIKICDKLNKDIEANLKEFFVNILGEEIQGKGSKPMLVSEEWRKFNNK